MEQYKPIPQYETYGINVNGEIIDFRSGKKKTAYLHPEGYYRIQLLNPNGYSSLSVARLVGLTYLDNPNNLATIDHIDRNRANNNVRNLRWADIFLQAENRIGWGSLYKCIYYEKPSKKSPSTSYRIIIRCKKLSYSKRFKTSEYTIDQVKQHRNELFLQNNIIITD